MFLWTMVMPFSVIEKEAQAKACVPAPSTLVQEVAVPTASSQAR